MPALFPQITQINADFIKLFLRNSAKSAGGCNAIIIGDATHGQSHEHLQQHQNKTKNLQKYREEFSAKSIQ